MRIIIEMSTGNIIDFIDNCRVLGLADGLQTINLINYNGNKTELNIKDISGGLEAYNELNDILNRFYEQINEINSKYLNLNISINDTITEAGKKMIIAGVTWEDSDIYAGRLKNLKQILLGIQ